MEQIHEVGTKIDGRLPVLYSAYFGPIEYYGVMMKHGGAVIDTGERYEKRSYRNRCGIVGANGEMTLTVPIARESSEDRDLTHAQMKSLRISYDTQWRHLHWQSLVSAYNMSPYFEYYEDDFRELYGRKYEMLTQLNDEALALTLRLLQMDDIRIERSETYIKTERDLRKEITPKIHTEEYREREYYQVFNEKYGFIGSQSILDLLFNMGPESRIILRDSMRQG